MCRPPRSSRVFILSGGPIFPATKFCIFPTQLFQKQEVLTTFFPPGLHSASPNARLDLAGSVLKCPIPYQLTAVDSARRWGAIPIHPVCQIGLSIPAPAASTLVQLQRFLQIFIPVLFTSSNTRVMFCRPVQPRISALECTAWHAGRTGQSLSWLCTQLCSAVTQTFGLGERRCPSSA